MSIVADGYTFLTKQAQGGLAQQTNEQTDSTITSQSVFQSGQATFQ